MRRLLVPLVVVLAAAVPAQAQPRALALTVRPTWFASSHVLFVRTSWTPSVASTNVSVSVSARGKPVRTLNASHWLIGRKSFEFDLRASLAAGTKLTISVHAGSAAGSVAKTVSLTT